MLVIKPGDNKPTIVNDDLFYVGFTTTELKNITDKMRIAISNIKQGIKTAKHANNPEYIKLCNIKKEFENDLKFLHTLKGYG